VIDRIQSFPLSSPLSKFLNGLEILLAKAQVRRGLRETSFISFILPYLYRYHDRQLSVVNAFQGLGK